MNTADILQQAASNLPWYENAIRRHAPGLAQKRDEARAKGAMFRASLKGGIGTRTSESYPTSTGFFADPRDERARSLSARDRGRQAFQNNPVARSLMQTEADNVIAEGMTVQAKTVDDAFNSEAEDKFEEWFDKADVRGVLTATGFQRQAWISSRVDGDGGIALVDQGESRLQYIPSDWIHTPDDQQFNKLIFDGVETNEVGSPIRFWILDGDEYGKRKFRPIPVQNFLWLPHLSRTAQIRGETAYATIFEWLNHLNEYVDGVALAAWMATVFGLIFKEANAGTNYASNPGFVTNSKGQQQRAITMENGSVKYIGPDDQTVQVDAKQPMQQTPDFIRMMMRLIGMPFDMPLELVLKDVSQANLSSLRGARQDYYRACRPKQETFICRVLSPIYRWWVSREVKIGGGIGKNDRFVTRVPDLYQPHEWQPRGWQFTDPVTEAQAAMLEIDGGFNSYQNVCAQLGRDFETIQKQNSKAREMREGLKIPMLNSNLSRHPQLGVGPQGDPLGVEKVEAPSAPADTVPGDNSNA